MNSDSSQNQSGSSNGKVLDLGSFRKKKETKNEFAPNRQPLYSSHLGSTPDKAGGKRSTQTQDADFGDRLHRIRLSLDKINRLMGELKKMSGANASETDNPSKPLN